MNVYYFIWLFLFLRLEIADVLLCKVHLDIVSMRGGKQNIFSSFIRIKTDIA